MRLTAGLILWLLIAAGAACVFYSITPTLGFLILGLTVCFCLLRLAGVWMRAGGGTAIQGKNGHDEQPDGTLD